MSYKRKDGNGKAVLEHRIGRSVTYHVKKSLMMKVGLEKEWREQVNYFRRKITVAKELQRLSDSLWTTQMKKLSSMVTGYRRFLTKFYERQGLLPCMTYVPINGQGELGLYIQALVDIRTFKLVAGEADDAALWNEVTAVREKSHVDMYQRAIDCAKALMTLPSVNKDIQYRMNLISRGQIPSGGLGGMKTLALNVDKDGGK